MKCYIGSGDYNTSPFAYSFYGDDSIDALQEIQNQYLYNDEFTDSQFITDHTYWFDGYGDIYSWITFSEELPTEDVKGFVVYDADIVNNAIDGGTIVFIQLSTKEKIDDEPTVDKSILGAALEAVPKTGFYQTEDNDRWNGKEYSPNGFWAEMQVIVMAAQQVFNLNGVSQESVNTAAETLDQTNPNSKLSVAIAKLIPTTKINGTLLYEAHMAATDLIWNDFQAIKKPADWTPQDQYRPLVTASNTSPSTYGTWQRELKAAKELLDSLYPNGVALDYTDELQQQIEDQADLLNKAVAALDRLAVEGEDGTHDDYKKGELALNGINLYANTLYPVGSLQSGNYTTASWNAFVGASQAALAAMEGASLRAGIGVKEARNYYTLFNALRSACYGLEENTGNPITVHFFSVDNYAVHKGETPQAVNNLDLSLPSGSTIADAMTAAGISFSANGLSELYCTVGYYINGMHLQTVPGYNQYPSPLTAGLRNGDTLLVVREMPAIRTNMSGSPEFDDTVPATYITLSLSAAEAEAGAAFTLSAALNGAEPGNRSASASPLVGAAVFASEAMESEEAAKKAALTLNTGFVTDASGQAEVKLYTEGWYALNVFDTGAKGGTCTGPTVFVHVTAASELTRIKEELKEELNALAAKYGEDFFKAEDWSAILAAQEAAIPAIEAAESSGDAYAAQHSAVNTISEIHADAEYYNAENLEYFRLALAEFPDDPDKLDSSYAGWRIDNVIRRYENMTGYQRDQLTAAEVQKYQQIVSANEAGLPEAKNYTVTVTHVVEGSEADRAAILDMMQWLTENPATADPNTKTGQTAGDVLPVYGAAYTITYSFQGETLTPYPEGLPAKTDNTIVCVSPVFPAYFHLRNGTLPASQSWRIGAGDLRMSSNGSITYLFGGLSYTINGKEYTIRDITVEGLSEDEISEVEYAVIDNSNYLGKDKNASSLKISKAFYRFIMPSENITITLTWAPVGGTDTEIAEAREAAKAAVTATFNEYDQADYSETAWQELLAVYQNAVSTNGTIDNAASLDLIAEARKAAITAMAAVKKISAGSGSANLPDYGATVGQVYISVVNNTFPGGSFTGDIIGGWYDLCERDTMMTCVLKALALNGFSWTGSGGTGYEITYLSSIYIDSNKNGSWDRGSEQKLGEFDGEAGSGWLGKLNDWFVSEGFPEFKVGGSGTNALENGDIIEIVYSQNMGADAGGTWGNSDTSLSDLVITGGTLSPAPFDGSLLNYTLTVEGESASIRVTPTAANKNYLVKTFLNAYDEDSAFYKRTEIIVVKPGDTLYVGVGEKAWPSMNKQGAEARDYTGTKYTILVYGAGASGIEARIEEAYLDIGKITYSTYSDHAASIEQLRADYEALPDKSAVTNADKLVELENRIKSFKDIDDTKLLISKLPAIKDLTSSDRDKVQSAYDAYEALDPAQKAYFTAGETNKLLKAVNTVALWDAMDKVSGTKDFASAEANSAGTVKTALESWIGSLGLGSGITVAVAEPDPCKLARDGTSANAGGTPGSYSAAVTFTIGSGAAMASDEKTVTGSITPKLYVKSSDAGVKRVTVDGVAAESSGSNAFSAVLPYGSDRAKATFEIVPAAKATASKPTTSNKGETWTFTVTAEDGTTRQSYTVRLTVSEVKATALESWVYAVGGDTKPVAVTNLVQAVNLDKLGLPEGTKGVSLWLELRETAANTYDLAVLYACSPKGTEVQAVPPAALTGEITLTLPAAGSEYSRVLYNGAYLEAAGNAGGITFAVSAAGTYTLIPDSRVAAVTFHLNGGTADSLRDGETVVYLLENDGDALPVPEKTGYAFKGWHGDGSVSSAAYTAVSNALPADLYALWQSRNTGAAVAVGGVSAARSGSVFTVTLPYGSEYPKAAEIVVTPEDSAATASKPMTGDDGMSWSFAVTAEDGTKKEYTLQVVIAEQTAEDILAAAKQTLADQSWDTDQRTANDAASLKTFVEGRLKGLELSGAAYAVTIDSVTPAKAGDEQNAQGTAGSYRFTVTLTSGGKSDTVAGSGSISAAVYVAPAQLADYEKALAAVEAYLKANVQNPDVGSTMGEWVVFALNRGGVAEDAWNEVYLENLKKYLDETDGILAEKNYTEYSRVILALTSMGVDASNITTDKGTYDLTAHLLDKQSNGDYWAEWQGNNGTAFALLAMDSHDYLDTAAGKAARAALIASLKANQQESGAWAIEGKGTPDLDVTAAAVYALAPYYLDSSRLAALGGSVTAAEVKAMVDNALAFLSGVQNADGGFGSVEADVWAIIALSSLGRDADTDPAFVKNGNSLLADMLSYRNESTGAFRHLAGAADNQMATEQAAYGLVAYDRFKKNQNTLYDMSDVEFATAEEKADRAAAEAVEKRIGAIGEVTLESKAKIDAARAAYNALTDEQKALVSNLAVLEAAEKKYKELTESAGQEEIDRAAAKGADDLIDAIGEVSLGSESDIRAARAAYDALTEEQKALVTRLDALEAAEAKLTALKADKAAAKGVDDLISAIGEVTRGSGAAIEAARNAYNALTEAQKRQVTKLPELLEAERKWELLNGSSPEVDDGKLHVTMRLIGAELAAKDVDLGKEAYLPNYVTWIPTTQYALDEGASVYDLWVLATWQYGIRSVGAEKNYVATVYAPAGYELSEFTNGKRSGWMYTINGRHPGFGLKEQPLHDGDVVVWHYVNDYSYEVADWIGEGAWQSLGDGTYYNRWLLAPDYLGGWGGGVGVNSGADPGSDPGTGTGTNPAPAPAGGMQKVQLPAPEDGWVVVLVKPDGTEELLKKSYVENGMAYALIPAGATVKVADNRKTFVDVKEDDWFAGAVDFVSSHELFQGVGENRFDPKAAMTRAMLVTVLYRLENEPRVSGKTSFSDVPADAWYADAVVWAAAEGIVRGNGSGFAPGDRITREQIATILYRYAAYLGLDVSAKGSVNRYGDGAKVSDWAADAMAWAVEVGLFRGDERGNLNPQGDATRAEVATLLQRLVKLILK